MGVEAVRLVSPLPRKEDITFNVVAPGGATLPGPGEITVVSMLDTGDLNRNLEAHSKFVELLNFFRERDFLAPTAADQFIAVKIFEPKSQIRVTAVISVQLGDLALSIDAVPRATGNTDGIYQAYTQMFDFMRENDRLTA